MMFERYLQHYLENDVKDIVGFLNPIEWDSKGNAKSFSIFTSDEEDIIITGKYDKRKLRPLLNKLVEAKGIIEKTKPGEKFINLKSIKAINSPHSPNMIPRHNYFLDDFALSLPNKLEQRSKELTLNYYQHAN